MNYAHIKNINEILIYKNYLQLGLQIQDNKVRMSINLKTIIDSS